MTNHGHTPEDGWCPTCVEYGKALYADANEDRLDAHDVLGWLNEALAGALVADGPAGNAIAAWVPIDRVLLARDRLAVKIGQSDDDLDAMAPGNFV